MNRIIFVLFLFLIWLGFSSMLSPAGLLLGALLAIVITVILGPKYRHSDVDFYLGAFISLIGYVIIKLIISSLQVAKDILIPRNSPRVIRVPHACNHPAQLALLTNILSLTPGTLFIDISSQGSMIIIHTMFDCEPHEIRHFVVDELGERVKRVFRKRG